jgi:ribonuclease HI
LESEEDANTEKGRHLVKAVGGVIKINVDAAFDIDQGKGGVGAIARNSNGAFLAASCKELHFVADPFMAEAFALRDCLSLAQFLGGNKFIIQSDNVQVIEKMLDGGFSATSSASIFDDCRLLSSGFRDITFEHCNREANVVAHELARYNSIQHFDSFGDDNP